MTARYRCPVLKAEIIRPTREDAREAFACQNCRSMKCNGPLPECGGPEVVR